WRAVDTLRPPWPRPRPTRRRPRPTPRPTAPAPSARPGWPPPSAPICVGARPRPAAGRMRRPLHRPRRTRPT
ncbi:MAG: hypothetical protein AVDCRST_MAG27-4123, partial [uncultured Craurococcus sp.]